MQSRLESIPPWEHRERENESDVKKRGQQDTEEKKVLNEKQTWKGFYDNTGKFPISFWLFTPLLCALVCIEGGLKTVFSLYFPFIITFHTLYFCSCTVTLVRRLLFFFSIIMRDFNWFTAVSIDSVAIGLFFRTTKNFSEKLFSLSRHLQNSTCNYFVETKLFHSSHHFARLSRSSDCCWTWCDLNFSCWCFD